MRAALIIAAVLAAGAVRADYACAFTERCEAGGTCERGAELQFAMTRSAEGWRIEAADAVVPMALSPEAGTYFGHVFIGAQGFASGMTAYQLSVARDGTAFHSMHVIGSAPRGLIWRGRCEEIA